MPPKLHGPAQFLCCRNRRFNFVSARPSPFHLRQIISLVHGSSPIRCAVTRTMDLFTLKQPYQPLYCFLLINICRRARCMFLAGLVFVPVGKVRVIVYLRPAFYANSFIRMTLFCIFCAPNQLPGFHTPLVPQSLNAPHFPGELGQCSEP
jgi:hypothetical protein